MKRFINFSKRICTATITSANYDDKVDITEFKDALCERMFKANNDTYCLFFRITDANGNVVFGSGKDNPTIMLWQTMSDGNTYGNYVTAVGTYMESKNGTMYYADNIDSNTWMCFMCSNALNPSEATSLYVSGSNDALAYPLFVDFYSFGYCITDKEMVGQGLLIVGEDADRVTKLTYNGLGGNFDASLSPIDAESYSSIANNAKEVEDKTMNISADSVVKIIDYASVDDEPISTALSKGYSVSCEGLDMAEIANQVKILQEKGFVGAKTFYINSDKSKAFTNSVLKGKEVTILIGDGGCAIDQNCEYGNMSNSVIKKSVNSIVNAFSGNTSLTKIDLTNLDTSNCKNMGGVFLNCSSLTSVGDISGWDTSKVTSFNSGIAGIFKNTAISELNIANWNTSSCTSFGYMFESCRSLVTLDLSGWDTSKGKTFAQAFWTMGKLISLDLSGWDMSNATSINSMFNCPKLVDFKIGKLPLSSSLTFDITRCPINDASMQWMVENTTGGCTIKFSNTTKALANYSTYKAALEAKGFTIE